MHRPQLRRPELDRRRLPVPRALMARAAEEAQPPLQAILMDDGTAVRDAGRAKVGCFERNAERRSGASLLERSSIRVWIANA